MSTAQSKDLGAPKDPSMLRALISRVHNYARVSPGVVSASDRKSTYVLDDTTRRIGPPSSAWERIHLEPTAA